MRIIRDDFDKRKAEIDTYFEFLSKLDKDIPTLHYSETGISYIYTVDTELLKILKANGFLLIYNLVESFCRNSLLEILTSIQNENISLKMLSEQAQLIWIRQKVKDIREASDKKMEEHFHSIAKEIILDTTIEFNNTLDRMTDPDKDSKDVFGLSGNIDARKIRQLAEIYGFESNLDSAKERAGAALLDIKTRRNQLAHGRVTFAECGRDKTVSDMIKYKENAIIYLEGVLLNIEDYIRHTKYKI